MNKKILIFFRYKKKKFLENALFKQIYWVKVFKLIFRLKKYVNFKFYVDKY